MGAVGERSGTSSIAKTPGPGRRRSAVPIGPDRRRGGRPSGAAGRRRGTREPGSPADGTRAARTVWCAATVRLNPAPLRRPATRVLARSSWWARSPACHSGCCRSRRSRAARSRPPHRRRAPRRRRVPSRAPAPRRRPSSSPATRRRLHIPSLADPTRPPATVQTSVVAERHRGNAPAPSRTAPRQPPRDLWPARCLGGHPLCRRDDVARDQRLRRRPSQAAPVTARHRIRRRQHLEDVPVRPDPPPRRGGQGRSRRSGRDVPPRAQARSRRSRSASCWTTRAGCTTSSTTRTSTRRCCPTARASGRPTRSLAYVGKPYFKPGKGWHYSNTNYVVLGLLAEAVEGAPLAEQLHARFLDPARASATRTTRRSTTRVGPARPRVPVRWPRARLNADPPDRRHGRGPVHVRGDRGGERRLDRVDPEGSRHLGPRALRRRRPDAVDLRDHGRRRPA